jgi:hypothetical protein
MLAKNLIDETVKMMHGFGQTNDRQAVLSNAIGAGDLTFTVDAAAGPAVGINPGFVEIDSEQLLVTNVDPNSNVCTVANGFGRGYDGTTATSHAQYARVVSQPKFPRNWVLTQMNEVIGALFPDLFAINTYTTTVTYPINIYTLPAPRPTRLLDVQWQDTIGNWDHCAAYQIDMFDGTVRVGGGMPIGRPLRFIYASEPKLFAAETDDFVTATGLPLTCSDLLSIGTCMKLAPTFDISRAQTSTMEQSSRSTSVPPNTGINIGTFLEKQFQQRLMNEAKSLRALYPTKMRRIV